MNNILNYKIIFIFVLIFFVSVDVVYADNNFVTAKGGIQVSPNRFDFNGKGGDVKDVVINIHNYDNYPRSISIEVEDFFVMDDSMESQFYVPNNEHPRKAYDIINWIDIPNDFVLKPNSSKNIHFKIHIPQNQPTNGYYGAIFFKTRAPDKTTVDKNGNNTGAKIKVNYRVGTLITMAIQGDEPMKIKGDVEEFGVTRKIFWDKPIRIFAKLHSDGNIHYKLKKGGKIKIKKFGKKFSTIILKPEVLYPGRTREFKEQVEFNMWDFGIYSATLSAQSEDGSVVFNGDDIIFLVIPWKTTIMVIGIIFLIFIIGKVFNKMFIITKKK